MDNITLKSFSQSTLALLFAAGISTAAFAADVPAGESHDALVGAAIGQTDANAKLDAKTDPKVEAGKDVMKDGSTKIDTKAGIQTAPVMPIK